MDGAYVDVEVAFVRPSELSFARALTKFSSIESMAAIPGLPAIPLD
jgi:hypothetical protein